MNTFNNYIENFIEDRLDSTTTIKHRCFIVSVTFNRCRLHGNLFKKKIYNNNSDGNFKFREIVGIFWFYIVYKCCFFLKNVFFNL
uniref:Uncharacterized protein n=1 Tax=Lepeophtheirus salmonis TaxID=72036 RepID=A0A0K2VA45_LEPSM